MDRCKFNEAQKLYHKIDACNTLLQVPRQNTIHVEIDSLYTSHAIIPIDLWCKILETVKEAKKQYEEELDAL